MRPVRFAIMLLFLFSAVSPATSGWTMLDIPPGENAQSLWFTNPATGFLSGNSVWRTDDGAATWRKTDIPAGNYPEIRFRDALTGYVAGTGTLLKTTDGGNHWQSVGPGSRSFKKLALGGNAVYGLTGGARSLWKSGDGGATWDSLADMGAILNHLAFPDSQSGFVSNQRDIYKTSDGGKQWRKVYSIRIGGLITDLQFLDKDTGYASAYYPGSILSTYDGGETWNEVSTKFWLYGLHFADSRRGWAVGNSLGEVLRTADAGVTWMAETTGGTGGFKDVQFPAPEAGYILASGNAGLLKYSGPSASIRPAAGTFFRGEAPGRFFDIRGARLPPRRRAADLQAAPGFAPRILWPSGPAN